MLLSKILGDAYFIPASFMAVYCYYQELKNNNYEFRSYGPKNTILRKMKEPFMNGVVKFYFLPSLSLICGALWPIVLYVCYKDSKK